MNATYALDLTETSADLFCRRDGGWIAAGSVPLPQADLGGRLSDLLASVGAPKTARIAVALPPDEVLVLAVPAGRDSAAARARAALMLDGRANPDAVRLDWAEAPEGLTVAATPLAILHEAETFLAGLGLEPAGCGARFGTVPFPGGAWFGFSDEPVRADGRAPRPDFLPLPWTTPAAAGLDGHAAPEAHAGWAGHPPVADTAADGAEAVPRTPQAFTAAPAPQAGHAAPDETYLAARARALAIARRAPVSFVPMTDEVVEPAAAPRRKASVPALVPERSLALRPGGLNRQVRRAAVLTACLVAGLAAASMMPGGLWPFGADGTDPAGEDGAIWDNGAESALWLDPAGDQAGVPPVRDLSPDDPEYILASFSPAAAYAAPGLAVDMTALSIPGIDRVFRADALALQDAGRKPAAKAPPVGLGKPTVTHENFAYDENGLIRPARNGMLSPEGYTVYAGAPPRKSLPRPERSEAIPPVVIVAEDSTPAAADPMGKVVPRTRPDGLSERFERARLGGKTEVELAAAAPRQRPASAQEAAAAEAPADPTPSSYAIASAPRPTSRSDDGFATFTLARANPVEIPAELAPLAMAADDPIAVAPKPAPAPDRAAAVAKPAPAQAAPVPAPARPAAVKAAPPRTELAAVDPVAVAPARPAAAKSASASAAAAKAQAQAQAAAQAEAEAQAVALAQAQARAQTQAKAQAQAQAQAQARAQAQADAKAQAKAQAQAQAQAKAQAKAQAQAKAEAKAQALAEAKAQAQAQAEAKAQAQAKAKAKAKAASKQSEITMVASAAQGATPAEVQARATDSDIIDLSEVNLLGTFGSSADARAIVRMPNGKVMNVAVGDKLNGGRVAGISEGQLYYVKRGKTVTLQMPRG